MTVLRLVQPAVLMPGCHNANQHLGNSPTNFSLLFKSPVHEYASEAINLEHL